LHQNSIGFAVVLSTLLSGGAMSIAYSFVRRSDVMAYSFVRRSAAVSL
jgi:hypothetical protein